MRNSFPLTSFTLIAFASLIGCGTSSVKDPSEGDKPTTTTQSLLMRRASSCEDLDLALREEARLRLAEQVQNKSVVETNGSWTTGAGGTSAMLPSTSVRASGGAASATMADDAAPQGSGDATNYSETNTQIEGIDEADIIKSDGAHLYVARNQELKIARAYPANTMNVVATQPIEGSIREMYVVPTASGSTVVVYSAVDAGALYDEANIPRPENSTGYYGTPMIDCFDCGSYFALPATKVTLLSLTSGNVTVQKEFYYEGTYLSSRRNGASVRTTLQVPSRAPAINLYADEASNTKAMLLALDELQKSGRPIAEIPSEEIDALVQEKLTEVLLADAEDSIDAISHRDWLPRTFERNDGTLSAATLPCQSFYIPASGSTSAGVTFVAQLDIASLQHGPNDVAMLGLADTMYENASKVVLSSRYWSYAPATGEAKTQTLVHQFDVSQPGMISYQASGKVPGYILNQFAMDERNGALRIVTTDDGSNDNSWVSSAGLYALQAQGSNLTTAGKLEGLAKSERVYAVRFLEDKAYIVTFRQTDPLFVLDVADPTTPKLLGELEIPGFSEYMHPLGDHHLLTIGRSANEMGRAGNLALQIFDVTDPVSPTLAHKHDFTATGSSDAEHNHKAFSFFDELGMLALPFYGGAWTDVNGYVQQNTLELFRVDVGTGFKYLGALDGDLVLSQAEQGSAGYYCEYPYTSGSTIERGLYIEDTLYAVGTRGIIASAIATPTTPMNVLKFDAATSAVPEYCWTRDTFGTGGSSSMPGSGGSGGFTGTPSSGGAPSVMTAPGGAGGIGAAGGAASTGTF